MKFFSLLYASIFLILLAGCENKMTTDQKTTHDSKISDESCYQQLGLEEFQNSNASPHIFIIIDQTTPFNKPLEKHLEDQLKPLFRAGNIFTLAEISTFSKDYHTRITANAHIDTPLTFDQEQDVPRNKIKKFKNCIQKQADTVTSILPQEIKKTLSNSNNTIDQSDLLKSFQDLADSTIKKSSSEKKVIIIASDMLEHSSITSFYGRNINPSQELRKIKRAGLLTDFQGAKVYVLGAGTISENDSKTTKRTIQTMQNLKKFWNLYFTASNATLVEFGAPELLNPIER